jgi:cell division inhibitor SepF
MGFLDKLKDKFKDGVFDDEDEEYEEAEEEEEEVVTAAPARKAEPAVKETPAPKSAPAATPAVKIDGAALELKVVKPERYEDVPQIADHLLNRRTVVLNLESSNKEMSKRIIDFLSGVAYAIDGKLSNVAVNTYLITPSHVSVTGEDLSAKKDTEAESFDYPED